MSCGTNLNRRAKAFTSRSSIATTDVVAIEDREVKAFARRFTLVPQLIDRQAEKAPHPFLMEELVHVSVDRGLEQAQLGLGTVEVERELLSVSAALHSLCRLSLV